MHSRVFQLAREPISKEDYITSFSLDGCFIGQIADYANESKNREEDLEWLASAIEPHGAILDYKKETIYFPEGFKVSYFKKRFEAFREVVERITLETFAGVSTMSGLDMHRLKSLIEDEFSFYIYVDYPQTLDDFVRDLEEDTSYYVGAIMDYHA